MVHSSSYGLHSHTHTTLIIMITTRPSVVLLPTAVACSPESFQHPDVVSVRLLPFVHKWRWSRRYESFFRVPTRRTNPENWRAGCHHSVTKFPRGPVLLKDKKCVCELLQPIINLLQAPYYYSYNPQYAPTVVPNLPIASTRSARGANPGRFVLDSDAIPPVGVVLLAKRSPAA